MVSGAFARFDHDHFFEPSHVARQDQAIHHPAERPSGDAKSEDVGPSSYQLASGSKKWSWSKAREAPDTIESRNDRGRSR